MSMYVDVFSNLQSVVLHVLLLLHFIPTKKKYLFRL